MKLTSRQAERFYAIWDPLLLFVNKKRQLMDPRLVNDIFNPAGSSAVRDVLWSDDTLLAAFVHDNPAKLDAADLAVARSWRTRVDGSFYVVKNLQKYSVFVGDDTDENDLPSVYGVLGINNPIANNLIYGLPCLVKAVLIPFEGKIIYDSLFSSYPIRFGRNITNRLNREYQEVKKTNGIIETLEAKPIISLVPENPVKTTMAGSRSSKGKKKGNVH